ncbi:MAG: hypothetical protein WBH47_22345 [Streptosporangiaceae bacterium]
MAIMNAAVVTSFDEPPHYQQFEIPQPASSEQILVDVIAVGLHPRVRTGAAGAHYTSNGTLPLIPGIDGVGRRADGRRIYFAAGDDVPGTMADQALADQRRAVELPDQADAAKVAAAMNPAMSSWVALRRRVPLEPGQSVLVLGAPATPERWLFRSPNGSAPVTSSAPGETSSGSTRSPHWAPTRSCR